MALRWWGSRAELPQNFVARLRAFCNVSSVSRAILLVAADCLEEEPGGVPGEGGQGAIPGAKPLAGSPGTTAGGLPALGRLVPGRPADRAPLSDEATRALR